jgi:nucleotide-binding universal stress UspA family protein
MSSKILAAFDGVKYSEGASKYAIEIAKLTDSMLVGVFIQDMRYINFTYAYAWEQPFIDMSSIEESQKAERGKIELNIKLFHRACEEKGIKHKVHLDKGVPLQELMHESAFSDMIIIDSHTSFFTIGNNSPSPFLKDFLTDSHCPVLIVPHTYTFFDNVVLCYDASPGSIYAIKSFSYLFPKAAGDLKTTVLSINEKPTNHLKDAHNFKDLVHLHFKDAEFQVLNGNPNEELAKYLTTNGGHSLVVMGAYGRNAISRLFHQSLSNQIIKELNIPVIITHQ